MDALSNRALTFLLMLPALLVSPLASAGPATDGLSACLVEASTPDDRQVLVRWTFLAISRHPDLTPMTVVAPAQATAIERAAGQLFQRLMTVDCVAPTRAAFAEGQAAAFGTAFQVLGGVAATDLFANPQVNAANAGLLQHMDLELIGRALQAPPQ
jgi:hypothetical protein